MVVAVILLSNFLGALIRPGDEIDFPLPIDLRRTGTEIYVRKSSSFVRSRDLYQAPISYAAKPKADKRDRLYVRAEVSKGGLGISSIHLPCEVIRDYFYVATRRQPWERQTSLYDVLRITPTASLAELRVAFRLRQLELRAAATRNGDSATLERAFNILAQPELRACYDSLLKDSLGAGTLSVRGLRFDSGRRRPLAGWPDVLRDPNPVFPARATRSAGSTRHCGILTFTMTVPSTAMLGGNSK